MKKSFSLWVLVLSLFSNTIVAQSSTTNYVNPSTVYKPVEQIKFQDFFVHYDKEFRFSSETKMEDITRKGFKYAENHRKYKQTFRDIPVYGVNYMLHGVDGIVTHGTGTFLANINVETTPSIDVRAATKSAIKYVQNGNKILRSKPKELTVVDEKFQNLEVTNEGLVIIDKAYPDISGKQDLAYKMIVKSTTQAIKYEVIVSASYGYIIFSQNLIKHGNAKGKGKTFYYGTKEIITDSIGLNQFVLRDLSRGQGITTYTMKDGNNLQMLNDADNNWDDEEMNDKVAIDAHFATEEFYDMMYEYFDYSGLDGAGLSMNPVIHYGGMDKFLNAFWDGDKAYFGHGDCHHGPLTTLSVVAHEFTHGVTEYNSNLIYNAESGALNESLSDIFGKSLEYIVDRPNFTWQLGDEFALDEYSRDFRSFSDPHIHEHPKKYKGEYWYDDADVHINSSVLNHWFYLLIEGVADTSEGITYNVPKVAINDILQIVFLCQTSYLTPSSTYLDMFESTKLACISLYGEASPQYAAIIEAWRAVGIEGSNTAGPLTDLTLLTQDISYTCIKNDYYDLSIFLSNTGNTVITKGTRYHISFLFSDIELDSELAEDLLPNTSVEISIKDFAYFDDYDNIFDQVKLDFEDDNIENNSAFINFENFFNDTIDFSLGYGSYNPSTCFVSPSEFYFSINNTSCITIPANTPYEIDIIDNGISVKKLQFKTKIDLAPTEYEFTIFPVNFPVKAYDLVLNASADSNIDNNTSVLENDFRKVINSSVSYDFNSLNFENEFKLDGFLNETGEYNNRSYFITYGIGLGQVICFDVEDNIAENGDYNTNIASACLDLTTFTNPALSFDMLQFRSDVYKTLGIDSINDFTSIMKVEYINDKTIFKKLIYGQEENKLINHSFALPKNSKGELKLSFYNTEGAGIFDESFIDFYDAILIDNLKIENSTSIDILTNDAILILPNPTNQFITIKDESNQSYNVQIINAQGQTIKLIQNSVPNTNIDVSTIPSGHYHLKLVKPNAQPIVRSFVKI